jgi:hypothetical protein
MSEQKQTSQQWYDDLYPAQEVIIMDPDGWDRRNWDYSWEEELITELEFKNRLFMSTCITNIK